MKITKQILASPQNLEELLAGQYAMGPQLPNGFETARPHLDQFEVKLLIELDSFPEKWDPSWGPRGNMKCYQLQLLATGIVKGHEFEADDYLGGCWDKDDDTARWVREDAHGYLPQMTRDALQELRKELGQVHDEDSHGYAFEQLDNAIAALNWVMTAAYLDQQRIYAGLPKRDGVYYYYEPPVAV